MRTTRLIFLLLTILFARVLSAAPLGTIPTIEDRNLRLFFDFRSDIWSSPYKYKSAPVRLINGEVRIPILKTETWKASADIYDESLSLGQSDFELGKESIFVGNSLRSQSVGLGANKDFEDGGSLSLFAAYATASDEPYGESRDTWIESTVIYRSKKIENHYWQAALNYSKNRGIFNDKVFPYVGISWQRDSEFTVVYGFPFLHVYWDNPEIWKKDFMLTPFGISFSVEKRMQEELLFDAYAAFTTRSYLPEHRIDDNERLFYQEFAIEGAIKKNLSEETSVIFGLGYSFDRKVYESETIYSPNSDPKKIDKDIFGRLRLEFRL